MRKWTEEDLIKEGYKIENVQIKKVDIYTYEYCMVQFGMELSGRACGCWYGGGYGLGHATLSNKDEDYDSYPYGIEYISRIMAIVGVDRFQDLAGKYIRWACKGFGYPVKIIGNIIEDKWFDQETFFKDYNEKEEKMKMTSDYEIK